MRRILAISLLLSLLAGCGAKSPSATEPPPTAEQSQGGDLMEGISAQVSGGGAPVGEEIGAVADFGVTLFQKCFDGGANTLVSPLSVLSALAMTANGADGDTLAQFEAAFGLPLDKLNEALLAYRDGLPAEDGGRTALANGIWFNTDAGLNVQAEFLQVNADYYEAAVRSAPFDGSTADQINAWVKDNTAGRVDQIVEELSPGAVMVLVNALAFDGEWEEIYSEDQIQPGTFTARDGQSRETEMMFSQERAFLQDENAKGFLKYYKDRNYAFAALLPDQGVDLADYAVSLTGERVRQILASVREDVAVDAAIPRFSAEYGATLNGALQAMGIADAFDAARADFSRLAEAAPGDLCIDRVLHKIFIQVDEKGTQAGAATAVEIRTTSMMGPMEQVHLDRPFLYMLIDCAHNVPLFIGAATDIK